MQSEGCINCAVVSSQPTFPVALCRVVAVWLEEFPNRVMIIIKMDGDSRSSAQFSTGPYLAGDSEQDQEKSVISALMDGKTED